MAATCRGSSPTRPARGLNSRAWTLASTQSRSRRLARRFQKRVRPVPGLQRHGVVAEGDAVSSGWSRMKLGRADRLKLIRLSGLADLPQLAAIVGERRPGGRRVARAFQRSRRRGSLGDDLVALPGDGRFVAPLEADESRELVERPRQEEPFVRRGFGRVRRFPPRRS